MIYVLRYSYDGPSVSGKTETFYDVRILAWFTKNPLHNAINWQQIFLRLTFKDQA